MSRPVQYATDRGEQEVATLDDGSRISLNTDTALAVRYDEDVREVRLDHGEAMFEVAPNARRPFIVRAGPKTVRALGTSFIVRRTGSDVAVVLIDGRVAVDDTRPRPARRAPVILDPGERLTTVTGSLASIDRPSLDAATAWRRGQAVFDDARLAEAVAEVNRYGGPQIVIEDPRVASLRVSGVFATNDTAEFARAVATLHGLRLERREGELRMAR
jgi:transmembrane sensor